MKKILSALVLYTVMVSCSPPKLERIGQEIIDGKVSATATGKSGAYGSPGYLPRIWVQNATETQEVEIPFDYEGRWKVGDSCLLIIEKYKEIPEKK